jgi:hypothetical protein
MPVCRNEGLTQAVCLGVICSEQNYFICCIALLTEYLTSCKDSCCVFRLLPNKILFLQRKKYQCDKVKCETAYRKADFYFSDRYSKKHNLDKNLTVNIASFYILLAK